VIRKSGKCYESNCNVIVRKKFLPKKLLTGGGGGVVWKVFLARTLRFGSLAAWPHLGFC
jgi:hypothetical protein